ncbi:hypothetical protein BDV12DRAFT_182760 [Aspergillus spectabilis]
MAHGYVLQLEELDYCLDPHTTVDKHSSTTSPLPPAETHRRFFQWDEPGTSKADIWIIFNLDCRTNTYFNASVIIGGPFSSLILTVVRPRFWLTFCPMTWLFFWIFVISGVLGQMFSGYRQWALYRGMHGKVGMAAWRWLFIFDFILAIPVAIYSLIFYPNTPETTTAFYLDEWERNRALERMEQDGRTETPSRQLYTFSIAYSLWTLTCGSYITQYFTLWLKSTGQYSIPEIKNIPTPIDWVCVDLVGAKGGGAVCAAVSCLWAFCFAVLTVWDIPHKLKMTVSIICGCYGCFTPLLAGAFVLAFMVLLGQAVVNPFQQRQFPSGLAPEFKETHGWPSGLAFVVALRLFAGVGVDTVKRIAKRK